MILIGFTWQAMLSIVWRAWAPAPLTRNKPFGTSSSIISAISMHTARTCRRFENGSGARKIRSGAAADPKQCEPRSQVWINQRQRDANGSWPIMIGNRPAIDARFNTRFVSIDGISDQQFALRVDEFRVGHCKIKERVMALKRVVDAENLFQWHERSSGIAAGGHENDFALI